MKISCREIVLGMFVSELDCAWSLTPFPVGGFHLRKMDDIQVLIKCCSHVYIDVNRGASPQKKQKQNLTILSSARKAAPVASTIKVKRDTYPITHSVRQHIDKAQNSYAMIKSEFAELIQQLRAEEAVDFEKLEKSADKLIEIIVENPQTFIWILNTEQTLKLQTDYCVRASIWATTLARQIGLSRNDMGVLFMGTMLADIGLHMLPKKLIAKRGSLSKKELSVYKKHVQLGLNVLTKHPYLDDRIVSILRSHHERHDGLGFPRGLRGEQIPVLARFAHLAYTFERLLKVNGSKAECPAVALNRLYKQRELKIPEQLVVEFIHVLGIYPAGTIVKLATGERALTVEQNLNEKLSPKIALITEPNKKVLKKPKLVELASAKHERENYRIVGTTTGDTCGVNTSDYTLKLFGKRVGFGPLSFRV